MITAVWLRPASLADRKRLRERLVEPIEGDVCPTEAGAPLLRKSEFLQHRRSQLHPRLQAWILTHIH
jgi:hypothetical protein